MNIAIIGPSGAGKGTQAARLANDFNLVHFSTGDVLRANLEDQTALGLLAKKYMNRGELVPDEVVDAMVEEGLLKIPKTQGVLFDGFPRTLHQAKFLDETLAAQGRRLDAVIYLKVPDDIAIARLMGRQVCSNCDKPYHVKFYPPVIPNQCNACGGELMKRADDTPEISRERLRTFHRATGLILDYCGTESRLVVVDGKGSVEHVEAAIRRVLESVKSGNFRPATLEEIEGLSVAGPTVLLPEEVAHPSLDLVLLGGPGCGKGTQAEQICRQFGLPHISTGDLFRENLKKNTDLGKLAKSYMDRGELVPDDVTEAMVKHRLINSDTRDGFLLDGFPRTLAQAHALDEMLTLEGRRLSGAILINVSDAEIIGRLSGRRICSRCQAPYHLRFKPPARPGICDACGGELYQRDDDNPETIKARLKTFHVQTVPLTEYYQTRELLVEVNGEASPAEVSRDVIAAAESLIPKGATLCLKQPS